MRSEPFRPMTADGFVAELCAFRWARRIWRVDLHHTYWPDHERWRQIGSRGCCEGMWHHHVIERGFVDTAQHVSIMPDGEIWTGRDWNLTPASVGFGMNRGVFMLETVGNFDRGCDRLEGDQLASVVTVVRAVQCRFGLPAEALLFHREVPQTEKTCPGTSVSKPAILRCLRNSALALSPVDGLAGLPLECHQPATAAA